MILETAIVNLTRNLEIIRQQDDKNISSHTKLKENTLKFLMEIIEKAPDLEYKNLLQSDNNVIVVGYVLNLLCQLSKSDKSREIRIQSLEVILALVSRLERLHVSNNPKEKCSIVPIITALPGVSSTLFQLIMSDTKLPKNLLITAIKTLTKIITVSFLPCEHKAENSNDLSNPLAGQSLNNTCDNLATRICFLVNYVTNHCDELAIEIKYEILNLCTELVHVTKLELLTRTLKSIVRYTAFITSAAPSFGRLAAEVDLKVMLIIDNIKDKIQNYDNESGRLDSVVFSCLFKLLDNMENHSLKMLINERQSELAMLCGLLKLLPQEALTSFLEVAPRRDQILQILIQLTEFSTQQPFLFLTDTRITHDALEARNEKIYTIEKRFSYINGNEVNLIGACCHIIGQNSEWSFLNDVFRTELVQFSSPSNLFITNLIMKGCSGRTDITSKAFRFTSQMIEYYLDKIQEEYVETKESDKEIYSDDILKLVIAIETLVTLVDLHLKFNETEAKRVIILKNLLYPLLNWCSSSSRAISETSLNTLARIGRLYGYDSTKSLIENNIDYIVDGVTLMLENFACNTEMTNVLAITFKLSSIETFYYFKDVYEKIFRVLGAYYFTENSKSIALLFYRTLSILSEWKDFKVDQVEEEIPLTTEFSIKSVIHGLDIDRRIKKLRHDMKEAENINQQMESMQVTEKDEKRVIKEIKSSEMPIGQGEGEGDQQENKKHLPADIVLTEKIMKHCIGLISSHHDETKILAMKTAACGFKILRNEEDVLLPLVHKLWTPLTYRLNGDYRQNLEVNLCAFECLVSMALYSKDFIKRRTLESIVPRLCLFLESQANQSRGKREYEPYCMTIAYKCQLKILTHLGQLAYHIQLDYTCLWRIIKTTLLYLDPSQVSSLREAARASLHYMIALDADCIWYYAKHCNRLNELPFELIFETK